MPARGLNCGDVGRVTKIVSPSRNDCGWVLLEFAKNGRSIQVDVDDSALFTKIDIAHKETLEDWVGASKILASVFTDVVESTSLGRALGDEGWMKILRNHFAQARSLMNPDKCYEIKMIGDSFMVAFKSVVDALDFALAFHADSGDKCVRIRAGIHVGPIRVFENDLFGRMVNYTKRVESTENSSSFIVISDEAKNHIDSERLCITRNSISNPNK